MEAIKLEFQDVLQPPPDGLPPDTGHLIPLQPEHKPPYRNPYRLSFGNCRGEEADRGAAQEGLD